jgi:hypothetical protein
MELDKIIICVWIRKIILAGDRPKSVAEEASLKRRVS